MLNRTALSVREIETTVFIELLRLRVFPTTSNECVHTTLSPVSSSLSPMTERALSQARPGFTIKDSTSNRSNSRKIRQKEEEEREKKGKKRKRRAEEEEDEEEGGEVGGGGMEIELSANLFMLSVFCVFSFVDLEVH